MTTNLVFLIVVSSLTFQNPDWKGVAESLADKHKDEAKVVRLISAPSVTDSLEGIREHNPTHVAFVMRPEEVSFKTTVALSRMMREIDEDPYNDALWGIVTGPTAADAKRIASSREPAVVTTALTTTGVNVNFVPGAVVKLSDANPPGCWTVKTADGKVEEKSSEGDLSHVFANAWNDIDPDFILTSAHASQRNLEMPFSRGNIVPMGGGFVTAPDIGLIDYTTGKAKENVPAEKLQGQLKLEAPKREKIWIAAGNCLIADNLQPGENMVMTALGFGKVNQFVGYTATTWFGEIGWGTWSRFANGMPLVEAYFAANDALIKELDADIEGVSEFKPEFSSAEDYGRLFQIVQQTHFKAKRPITNPQALVGRLWDRDATVFYGDPMQKVYLKKPE